MKEEKTEGIVLRCQEYQETSRIISVFTHSSGLLQFIVKKIANARWMTLTTPFTCAEFHYHEGRSSLFRLLEGSVINEHLFLREKLSFLRTAGAMTSALLHTLLPGSPDPLLYILYKNYLNQIPVFDDSSLLLTSFFLKFLRYEGLLDLTDFPLADQPIAESLATVRTFEMLQSLKVSSSLQSWTQEKITFYLEKN